GGDGDDGDLPRLHDRRRLGKGSQRARWGRSDDLLHLQLHILDDDVGQTPDAGAIAQRLPRILDVNVYFDRALVADDDRRVAHRVDSVADALDVELLTHQDKLHIVWKFQNAALRHGQRLRGDVPAHLGPRHNVAHFTRDITQHPFKNVDEALAARIDHAGLFQYGQQIGRALQ